MKDDSGKYVLGKLIGRGGMGEVWEAHAVNPFGVITTCAVKVLIDERARTESGRDQLVQEAQIAAQLSSSRIVKVMGTTSVAQQPAIVFEWVDGVSLRDLIERTHKGGQLTLGLPATLYIVCEVLEALMVAHAHKVGGVDTGVCHHDIKPENILISSRGEVKLTDFGVARIASTLSRTLSKVHGTAGYMAPEQWMGKPNRASDLYSLGVVLHELLEGERLFSGKDADDIVMAVTSGQVPPLKADVPAWVEELRRQMLAPTWRDRPKAAEARRVIVRNAERYQLGCDDLGNLYQEHVGTSRSGYTKTIRAVKDESSIPTPSVLRHAVLTVAERAEDDAPAAFRRPNRATPSAPTVTNRAPVESKDGPQRGAAATGETAPARPAVDLSAVTRREPLADSPAHDPVAVASEATSPFPPTEVLPATPRSGGVPAPVEVRDSSGSVPSVVAEDPDEDDDGGPRAVWFIVAAAVAALIFGGIGVGVLVGSRSGDKDPPGDDKVASVEDPGPAVVGGDTQPELADDSAEAVEVRVEEAPAPDMPPADLPVEDLSPPVEADDSDTARAEADHGSSDNDPEVATSEAAPTKKQPKPKKVEVALVMSATSEPTDIRVGGKVAKGKRVTQMKLAPGRHKVSWRPTGESEWRRAGTLRVESLPAGNYYEVRINATSLSTSTKKVGGGG